MAQPTADNKYKDVIQLFSVKKKKRTNGKGYVWKVLKCVVSFPSLYKKKPLLLAKWTHSRILFQPNKTLL